MRRARLAPFVLAALAALAACIPEDDAPRLGSVEFTFGASRLTRSGMGPQVFVDGYRLTFDRVLLSYDSVTVSETTDGDGGAPDLVVDERRCAYRGRGARKHVVFDPRLGNVQTLNGMEPGVCPDVGFVLEAPGPETEPGPGATWDDVAELAADPPAVALVEAHAERSGKTFTVKLRFDRARAITSLTACQVQTATASARGVTVRPGERQALSFDFRAEALLRDDVGNSSYRLAPFEGADSSFGDGDGVVTFADLDARPLSTLARFGYVLANGSRVGSLGDFVRQQLGYAFGYLSTGYCLPSSGSRR